MGKKHGKGEKMRQGMETKAAETAALEVTEQLDLVVRAPERMREFFADGKGLDALFAFVAKKARAMVANPLTKEGAALIRKTARDIATVKARVDERGKDVVAELKALPKVIDDNRRKWRRDMEALQEEILAPVAEIDVRTAKIAEISEEYKALDGLDSNSVRLAMDAMKKRLDSANASEWKESLDDARKAMQGQINAMGLLLDRALRMEAEQRELEELRAKQEEADRIVREQKIREEAARMAKEEAGRREAEQARKLEAARKAQEEAERRAAEAEKERRDAVERARAAEDARAKEPGPAKPATDDELRLACRELKAAILEYTLGDEDMAKGICLAIYRGKIPHVKFTVKEM